MHRRAEWREARSLLEEVPEEQRDADLRRLLARLQLDMGDWQEARRTYESASSSDEDNVHAAATWHQMATIDLREGQYAAAREKFQTALEIKQRIGDRYGEGATLYQLGQLAFQLGAKADGVRLVAICFVIDQAIGHGDAQSDLASLLALCQQLGYSEEQIRSVLREATEEYPQDAGQGLLERAFDSVK